MPNTFAKLYIHHISAVKFRDALIDPVFEDRLHQYMAGTIKELGQIPIRINGMQDHIHIAAKLKPAMAPSKLVGTVKANASRWINDNGFLRCRFEWQTGGSTYSIGERHLNVLINYIAKQKDHHKKITFQEEYLRFLFENGIDADNDYLPEFFDGLY